MNNSKPNTTCTASTTFTRTFTDRHLQVLHRVAQASTPVRFKSLESSDVHAARDLEILDLVIFDKPAQAWTITSKGNNFLCNEITVPREFTVSAAPAARSSPSAVRRSAPVISIQ